MSLDYSNNYTHAGPGAKRTAGERLTIETVKRHIAKPKPNRHQTPKNAKAAEYLIREERRVTPRGLKHRIRTLTCNTDGFSQMYDELKQANYPGSKVCASSIRNDMLECIKVMVKVGLINEDDLARHRRAYKKQNKPK
jgi:hypothetical protein